MKIIITQFLFLGITLSSFAQSPDDAAIKTVIEKETTSWMAADAEGWASCWKISPYTRILVAETNGKTHVITPDMMTNNKQYMGGGGKSDNSNYNIVATNTTDRKSVV